MKSHSRKYDHGAKTSPEKAGKMESTIHQTRLPNGGDARKGKAKGKSKGGMKY